MAYRNLTLASGAYGAAVRSPFTPATTSTLYRLASVTKILPTLLAFQAAEDGALSSLDAPVSARVPDFSVHDPWEGTAGRTISWRNLASHLGGLPRNSPLDETTTAGYLAQLATLGGMIYPVHTAPQCEERGAAAASTSPHGCSAAGLCRRLQPVVLSARQPARRACLLNSTFAAACARLFARLGISEQTSGVEYTPEVLAKVCIELRVDADAVCVVSLLSIGTARPGLLGELDGRAALLRPGLGHAVGRGLQHGSEHVRLRGEVCVLGCGRAGSSPRLRCRAERRCCRPSRRPTTQSPRRSGSPPPLPATTCSPCGSLVREAPGSPPAP